MNKLCANLILSFACLGIAQAQDGFIKFSADYESKDKKNKCLKGEILPFLISKKVDNINILFGQDTIFNVAVPSSKFDTFPHPNLKYASHANDFIQVKRETGLVYVNAESINSRDTVTLISETGTQLTQLILKREAQVRLDDCGKKFRLIVTSAPSIFYDSANLKEFAIQISNDAVNQTPIQQEQTKGFFEDLAWWYYLVFIVGVATIGIVIWFFAFRKNVAQNLEPIYIQYNGNSLKDFAADNKLRLSELIKLNKKVIDKNYESYDEKGRKECQREIKGNKLIIGYHPKSINEGQDENDNLEKAESNNWPNSEPDGNLSELLLRIESNLIREIKSAGGGGKSNSHDLSQLSRELNSLKEDKIELESQKQNLHSTIVQLRRDKESMEKTTEYVKEESNRSRAELNQLKEKVILVEFLKGYCEEVFFYFKLCDEVSVKAHNYFNRLCQQSSQQEYGPVGHLLMKFESNTNPLPVGNWVQIVQDIKDTGVTTNKQLIRSFSQITHDNEKQREFTRLFFTEILIKYSSSVLILAEAFRNLSRFQVSSEVVNEAQITFTKYVPELLNKMKSIGLQAKYVPLFRNYMDYLGQSKAVDEKLSAAYRSVQGLEKDSVAEVVSYGFKNTFSDTDTLIILV